MWVSHSEASKSDDLGGAQNLTEDESIKLWNMIDALDLHSRKKGKVDDDKGTVTLRLREPTDEGPHDVYTVYISRDTSGDDVLSLGKYLQKLVTSHFKKIRPSDVWNPPLPCRRSASRCSKKTPKP